jgi:asparagine synthase (glutamine-hydrolysing)
MCGINGRVSFDKNLEEEINIMNNLIFHRGPDDEGTYIEENDNYSLALGMRRLSIIDIESGSQPIFSDDKQVIIVFNGEIYNYQKLKIELKESNTSFKTNSDTEVILKLYLKFGIESFSKLDGMFAFSIYDKRVNKLYIARDFFGEKPLYYTNNERGLLWGSELKSLKSQLDYKPEICTKALELYFSLTYIPAPYTIYENVLKLEPNKYIEYSIADNNLLIHQISENNKESNFNGSFNDAKEKTKKLVNQSVLSRSISDVPIGTFLSGGVDSSIVSYCLSQSMDKKIDTFSIGFDKKKFDETEKSRVIAKLINSNHHEYIVNEKTLYGDLDRILNNFDEPFADSSALPTYLVSKKTSNHVKVALTGDGGDEVFGGYNKYHINTINNFYTNVIPEKAHKLLKNTYSFLLKTKDDNRGVKFKIKKTLDSIDYNNNFYWHMISLGFKENEIIKLIINGSDGIFNYYKTSLGLNKSKTLSDLRNIDKHISLEGDMLVKVDRTSMLSSLECRAPFLNKQLWEFTNSLPSNYLIKNGSKKHILKESFKDVFPPNFLEKSKKGFGVPVGDWLRTILKDELMFLCNKSFVTDQNLFNFHYVTEIVSHHLSGKEDNTFKVWTYFCFQKWYIKSYAN